MKRARSGSFKMSPTAIYESNHANSAVTNDVDMIANDENGIENVTIVGAGPAGLMLA
jgi:NADPH-dependent 2,4-dienoyl-CoA reductase/sulfur reductase-like enzyme